MVKTWKWETLRQKSYENSSFIIPWKSLQRERETQKCKSSIYISTQLGGMLRLILRKGWIAFNLYETLLKMVQNLSQCTSLLENFGSKGFSQPQALQGARVLQWELAVQVWKKSYRPILKYISFDSKNNHFFQMIKTNARKFFFCRYQCVFCCQMTPKT